MNHTELIEKLLEQYNQKNLAYGNSAHRTFCRYGKASYSLRLSDKFQRFENLISTPGISCADEAIEDTLGDAITYTYMFAADIFCSYLEEPNPDDDFNMKKVHEMMMLTACCTESEIKDIAHSFWQSFVEGENSLVDVIYNMYLDENTTSLDYVMLATYLIKLYMERINTNE